MPVSYTHLSGILKEELLQGKYSQLLKEIYLDESMLEYQNKRYADAITEFEKLSKENQIIYDILRLSFATPVSYTHLDVYKRQISGWWHHYCSWNKHCRKTYSRELPMYWNCLLYTSFLDSLAKTTAPSLS